MKFLVKTVGSAVLGMFGGWIGGYVGMGTSLFASLIFSIVGWYGAKYLLNSYLE